MFCKNVSGISISGQEQSNIRAPPALPRLVYPCMSSIVDYEQRILRLVLLDQLPHPHHQLEVRVLARYWEDVGFVAVVLAQALP